MTIKLSNAAAAPGPGRTQLVILATVGILGLGGSGVLIYKLVSGPRVFPPAVSPDEAKLAARAEERRVKADADARRLHQQDLGQGYQFDAQGNLLGASADASGLPRNRQLQEITKAADTDPPPIAAIGRGIDRGQRRDHSAAGRSDDDIHDLDERRGSSEHDDDLEQPSRRDGPPLSMLGYSTVAGASWAVRRPEKAAGESRAQQTRPSDPTSATTAQASDGRESDAITRLIDTMEKSTRAASDQITSAAGVTGAARPAAPPTVAAGVWGSGIPLASPGPSAAGEALYAADARMPAERTPQSLASGAIGDMRIGGGLGPDQIIRQGKFLDCALVNEIRADLVDSPVIAMVSRDYVSLDGKYVLVPAGAKLLGEAGRVQNLQQERVYIKFDRVIFPDQRSAYFPVHKVSAVDRAGSVGMDGDVDRHLMLQFGAAVMLGVLDGAGAAVQSPSAGTNPTLRDLVMARTSADFSTAIGAAIQKYANVVPTVTVEPGAKMKVFFAEDVRVSPYMKSSDLRWMVGR